MEDLGGYLIIKSKIKRTLLELQTKLTKTVPECYFRIWIFSFVL